MLRFSNRHWRVAWRRVNTAALAGLLAAAMAFAPSAGWILSPAQAQEIDAPKLDDGHVDQVYHMVEEWVRAGKTPGMARPVRVTGLGGVRVTLRWLGLTVGLGEVRERDLVKAAQGGGVDLAGVALKATGDALTQVAQAVRQRGREGGDPFLSLTGRLLVDLQVASPTEVVRVDAKAEAGELYHQFVPGYHGLVMSSLAPNGRTLEAWTWPGNALAMTNSHPQSQLRSMLSELRFAINDLERVGQPGGVPLQRFTVRHMVRPAPDREPAMLVRGHVILPPTPLDGDQVSDLSHKLVLALLRRMEPQAGMMGTHLPAGGQFDPATASEEEQALALYVLTRWANWQSRRSPGDKTALAAETAVRRGFERLWGKPANKSPEILRTPAVIALSLLAATDSPVLAAHKPLRDELAARLRAMQVDDGSFRASADDPEPLSRPNQALTLTALAHYFDRTRDPATALVVHKGAAFFWQRAEAARIVRALPWIVDVELRMSRLLAQAHVEAMNQAPPPAPAADADKGDKPDRAVGAGNAPKPAAPVKLEPWPDRTQKITELVALFHDRQIVRAPQGAIAGPADVVGGFDFNAVPMGVAPNPDSDSAFPLALISAVIRDPSLVPASQRVQALLAGGLGARFIAQLTFEPPSLYYARSPEDCLGGVRAGLWDNRLTNPATCMSLLALVELLESIDAIEQMGGLEKK